MGGAQYWWRITLIGDGRDRTYSLDEFSIGHGEKSQQAPDPIPYRRVGSSLNWYQLADALHDSRTELASHVRELSLEKPTVELYYDWHMAI